MSSDTITKDKIEIVKTRECLSEKNILTEMSHDVYYYYISKNNVEKNVLRFSNINELSNDTKEYRPKDFKYDFSRCISYFKNESVAMWSVYAPCGCCMRITKSVIDDFENKIDTFTIHFKNGKLPEECDDIEKFEFKKKHVIYYSDNEECIYIKRSTHPAYVSEELFEELKTTEIMKNICWDYECELRLCLAIKYDKFDFKKEDVDYVDVKIKCKQNQLKYFNSPFTIVNSSQEKNDFNESSLKNINIKVNKDFLVRK